MDVLLTKEKRRLALRSLTGCPGASAGGLSAKITSINDVSSKTVYYMIKSCKQLEQQSDLNRNNNKRRILFMYCPYLECVDTGWFTGRYECKVTGQEVGDLNHTTKVDYTCKKDCFNCPVYKRETRGY
jgi:hypothetical protein